MKRISLILLLFIAGFFIHDAKAQDTRFGLKGGLNIANIGGDSEGVSSRVAFHIGGYAAIPTSDLLTIQPELVFSSQGAKLDGGDNIQAKYSYINIPVIFKIFPSEGFNFQAGPQLGILASAKIGDNDVSVDVKDDLNTIDFAIALGLGYDLDNLNFAARYNLGISNTVKESDNGSYPNGVFQISLGYTF